MTLLIGYSAWHQESSGHAHQAGAAAEQQAAGCRIGSDTLDAAGRDDGPVCDPAGAAGGRQEESQRLYKTGGKRYSVSDWSQRGRSEETYRNQLWSTWWFVGVKLQPRGSSLAACVCLWTGTWLGSFSELWRSLWSDGYSALILINSEM